MIEEFVTDIGAMFKTNIFELGLNLKVNSLCIGSELWKHPSALEVKFL